MNIDFRCDERDVHHADLMFGALIKTMVCFCRDDGFVQRTFCFLQLCTLHDPGYINATYLATICAKNHTNRVGND